MSAADPTFEVVLKQLAPDAKRAELDYGEAERPAVSARELRLLLRAAEKTAVQVTYPLAPEVRITTPAGRYVVHLKDGRLNLVTWSSATSRGGNPTADQIFALITGQEIQDDTTPVDAGGLPDNGSAGSRWRWATASALVVAIIGINFYSVWNYQQPPGNLVPPFRFLEPEPAKRLLESSAGFYETGGSPGDRRLEINPDGRVVWIKFGADRRAVERKELTALGAESEGQRALFTNRKSLIKVKDQTALVLFGDTYLRVPK